MSTGERLTWETCPRCGRCAAVGWRDGVPVAVDCPRGCRPAPGEFEQGTPRAARWAAAAHTWT